LLEHLIADTDVLLVMSVNPGFGGQRFIPEALEKLRTARALIDEKNPQCVLEVDGGVGDDNILDIARAGADVAVMGNSIFNTPDPRATIERYRSLLAGAATR